jgi:Arm DNA-binding domain
MRGKLITKRLVDALAATDAEYFVWDRDLKGFGVRVQRTGEKSYVVKYRAGSGRSAPTRRVTLEPVGNLTPDEARRLAKTTLGSVAHLFLPPARRIPRRCGVAAARVGLAAATLLAEIKELCSRHLSP